MAAIYGGDEVNAVVLDLGTWQCRAGYAGDDTPKAVFPSLAGATGTAADANGMEVDGQAAAAAAAAGASPSGRKLYVGSQELGYRRPHMEVASPFSADGLLSDWDVVARLWDCALRERLHIKPEENAVLFTEPTHNTKEVREKTVQMAFEHLRCPALFLSKDAVLSTFSVAKQTSIVVDSGYNATTVAGVHDGYVLTKSISRSPVGGKLLNTCLQKALEARGIQVKPRQTFKRVEKKPGEFVAEPVDASDLTPSFLAHQVELIVGDVKEAVSRVSDVHFIEADNLTVPSITYELPDGNEIKVGVDRFKVPELLFQPSLVRTFPGMSDYPLPEGVKGLASVVVDSVNCCDTDVRKDLYQHVVLTGGTSLLAQMRERLELDICAAATSGTKVKVTAPVNPTERRYATWIGGSILASLGSFQQMWMSKQEYDEHGPGRVHRKCP